MAQSRNDALLSDVSAFGRREFLLGTVGIAGLALFGNAQKAFAAKASDETLAALGSAQAEYQAAMAELASIGMQLEEALYKLDECRGNLDATVAQIGALQEDIAQKQDELVVAQDVLYDRINASYRAGSSQALELILDSTGYDDFISRVYYANKVNDADAEAIGNVKEIKARLEADEAQLEDTKAYQEQLLVEQQQYTDDLSAAESYYESYTAGLSGQVVALMAQAQAEYEAAVQAEYEAYLAQQAAERAAAEAAAEAAVEAQTAEERQDQVEAGTGGETVIDEGEGAESQAEAPVEPQSPGEQIAPEQQDAAEPEPVSAPVPEPEPEPVPAPEPEPEPVPEPTPAPVSSGNGNHVPGALDAAWGFCGVPYVWGGSDPSGFDCSGLAMYCYGLCGYDIARTTYGQIAEIQALGNWKTSMGELSPGDLVFPHSGHVGIYAGGGMMIHAPTPGDVVRYASVYSFMGGGCPV